MGEIKLQRPTRETLSIVTHVTFYIWRIIYMPALGNTSSDTVAEEKAGNAYNDSSLSLSASPRLALDHDRKRQLYNPRRNNYQKNSEPCVYLGLGARERMSMLNIDQH